MGANERRRRGGVYTYQQDEIKREEAHKQCNDFVPMMLRLIIMTEDYNNDEFTQPN